MKSPARGWPLLEPEPKAKRKALSRGFPKESRKPCFRFLLKQGFRRKMGGRGPLPPAGSRGEAPGYAKSTRLRP
jgi:hypothetical protein